MTPAGVEHGVEPRRQFRRRTRVAQRTRHRRSAVAGIESPAEQTERAIWVRDEVRAFDLTPQQAMGDFVRRELCYDGPVAEIYPCSPELYRQLEATTTDNLLSIPCRIDSYGIAFPAKDAGLSRNSG
jgi:hypothetical protein